jgi:hypothetical protein
MPTDTHPIEAPASLSLFAACILIIGLLATAVDVHLRTASLREPSTAGTVADTVAGSED